MSSQRQDNFIVAFIAIFFFCFLFCLFDFFDFFAVISVESTVQITSSSLQNKVFAINKYIDLDLYFICRK